MDKIKVFLSLIVLFGVGALIIVFLLPNNTDDFSNSGKLIINEIQASNINTTIDSDGDYSDWIEIYNGYDYDIDLDGYYLSDQEFETSLWKFPDIKIKKNSYLVIYASGKDKCVDNECHTNFKLNKDNEIVVLSDNKNNILSKVSYISLDTGVSYGFKKNRYVYFNNPTPGYENDNIYSKKPIRIEKEDLTVSISEYMTSNETTYLDEDGDYVSVVELYNYGDKDINLEGYYLSDNEDKLDKYKFSSLVIKSKSYEVIYLSGKDRVNHTSFKLSKKDKFLILSDYDKNIVEKINLVSLKDDVSYGKNNKNEWCFYTYPTIGYENNTKCFSSLN